MSMKQLTDAKPCSPTSSTRIVLPPFSPRRIMYSVFRIEKNLKDIVICENCIHVLKAHSWL